MQGTIKIDVEERGERIALGVECNMEASREVYFHILNTLMTESFGMDDSDIMMFMVWRKMMAVKSESVKIDLSAMHKGEKET